LYAFVLTNITQSRLTEINHLFNSPENREQGDMRIWRSEMALLRLRPCAWLSLSPPAGLQRSGRQTYEYRVGSESSGSEGYRLVTSSIVARGREHLLSMYVKKRRVIPETDSDEEEGGSGDTRAIVDGIREGATLDLYDVCGSYRSWHSW
jgi:hypothetical protein